MFKVQHLVLELSRHAFYAGPVGTDFKAPLLIVMKLYNHLCCSINVQTLFQALSSSCRISYSSPLYRPLGSDYFIASCQLDVAPSMWGKGG